LKEAIVKEEGAYWMQFISMAKQPFLEMTLHLLVASALFSPRRICEASAALFAEASLFAFCT
jgi:hypothetical protein